jgi:short-subunit dehydrogenase
MNASEPKKALVTGASYGLGRAISVGLARKGMDLILTARSKELLEETADAVRGSGSSATVIAADISTESGREALLGLLGQETDKISVFVHAASANTDPEEHANLLDTPDETIDALVKTTIAGTIFLTKALIPFLERGAPANVILIASDWALKGSHGPPVFSAAKAAVAHLGHSLRRSLGARRISMTVLYPGDVASFDADWTEPKWQIDDPLEAIKAELGNSRIPLVDIVETIDFIIARKMSRIEELWISPLDPDYDY